MKTFLISIVASLSLLSSFTSTSPVPSTLVFAIAPPQPTATKPQPSAEDLQNAVLKWQNDTRLVSDFLNVAGDPESPPTGQTLIDDASSALNSENDEGSWKAIIDGSEVASKDSRVAQANDILATQGTTKMVVQGLQSIMTNGDAMRQQEVDSINKVRCSQVLPAVDMYFAAVADFLNGMDPKGKVSTQKSVRPTACQTK